MAEPQDGDAPVIDKQEDELDKTVIFATEDADSSPRPEKVDHTVVQTGVDHTGTSPSVSSTWSNPATWSATQNETLQVGSVIKDRFQLVQLLGEGGMGKVYKALDNRKVEASDRNPYIAVKILNDEFKNHPESLKALQREARKAQDLAHPNIVNVFDFDREGTNVFMTMEYLDGRELKYAIRENPDGMPMKDALHIIEGVCSGLSHAHRKGVVHADFKPGNVFLTRTNAVKIIDFGIARAAQAKEGSKALKGEVTLFDAATLGALTPAYASPEMFRGVASDPRDDLYALSCIAFELFYGQHPFGKKRSDKLDASHLQNLKRMGKLNRRQWKGLLKGLALDRNERIASAEELLDFLQPRKNRLPLIMGIAGVGLGLTGYFAMPAINDWRYETRFVSAIESDNDQLISDALQYLDKLSDNGLSVVRDRYHKKLFDYFQRQARLAFAPDRGGYDYPLAVTYLDSAGRWFDESTYAPLKELKAVMVSEKNKLLSKLDQKYVEFIQSGNVLPDPNNEDVFNVIRIIGTVSPDHPLLSDDRLRNTFVREARKVLAMNDLQLTEKYVRTGLVMFSDDVDLLNIKDELTHIQKIEEEEKRVAQLEKSILEGLDDITSIHGFEDLQKDIQQLSGLGHDSPVLKKVAGKLVNLLDHEVDEAIQSRDWQSGKELLAVAGTVVDNRILQESREKLDNAYKQHEERLAGLYADFDDLVASGRLDGEGGIKTASILSNLEELETDRIRLNQARNRFVQAYVASARQAKQNFEWERAHRLIDSALAGPVDEGMRNTLQTEKEDIALAQKLYAQELVAEKDREARAEQEMLRLERERQKKEKQEQIQSLYAKISMAVDSMQPDETSAAQALTLLNQLEMLSPGDEKVAEGRKSIVDVFVGKGQELYAEGDFVSSIELLQQGRRVMPGSDDINGLLAKVDSDYKAEQLEKQKLAIVSLKKEIDELAGQVLLTQQWEKQLVGKLQSVEPLLAENDPWIAETRSNIALLYASQAREKRKAQRFTEAYTLLDRGGQFDSTNSKLVEERQLVESAEKLYRAEAAEKARIAEVEGLKQTFRTQAQANEVDRALQSLAQLEKDLDRDDPFITKVAPEALSNAYMRLAEEKAAQENWQAAISQAELGLKKYPRNVQLAAKLREYQQKQAENSKKDTRDEIEALKNTLQALARRNDVDGARRSLLKLQEELDSSDPFLTRIAPTEIGEAYIRLAEIQASQENLESAIKLINRGLEVNPQNSLLKEKRQEYTKREEEKRTVTGVIRSKRPCTTKLAGYGRRARAVCYDMIDAETRGPSMVVVPASAENGFNTPFAIGRYEVSVEEYNEFCRISGTCTEISNIDTDLPITGISITDAANYAQWLTESTGFTYRIPTEDEWVYAAEADNKKQVMDFNCSVRKGSTIVKGKSLISAKSGEMNGWGLRNHIGNAQEWVKGGSLFVRGGSYEDPFVNCDVSLVKAHSGNPDGITGLRLLREIEE